MENVTNGLSSKDLDRPGSLFRTHGASLIVFFIIILLTSTFFAWYYTRKAIQQQSYIKFQNAAEETKLLIKDRADLYINTLYGAKALFAASKSVERGEWAAYFQAENLRGRYPGITAVCFAEKVEPKNKEDFVKSVISDTSFLPAGFPDFKIEPTGDREEYNIIKYVEPYEGNEKMLGFDLKTDPARSVVMEQARDGGEPVMTGRLNIMPSNDVGATIFMPIYKNREPVSTAEERKQALQGYVEVIFRVEDLFSGIFGKKNVHPEIGFQVYDGHELTEKNLLYDDEHVLRSVYPNFRPRFSTTYTLRIAGRTWTLRFSALPDFGLNETEEKLPVIVLFGGIVFSLLLFGILYSFATARSQAVIIAEGMTSKLRESEHRYADLIEGAPDPIITMDRLGYIRSMNPAAEKLSGYRVEEILGKYFAGLGALPPSSLPKALQEFALAVVGKERAPFEIDILRKNGTKLIMEANPRPIKQAGKTIAVQIIFRDITERKNAEKILEESRNYLDKIMNSVADPIFVKDRKHRWVLLNDAYCHFMGYKRDELIGKSDHEFFPKEEADVFWDKDEFVFETGKENLNEENFTDAHGVTHIILTKKSLYTDVKGQKYIVGIIRDFSSQKESEQKIKQLNDDLGRRNQELINTNKELEAFSYSISHDLRAPLRAINGFANALLEDCVGSLDAEGKRYLDLIHTNAQSMGQLIDDLLAFSRLGRKQIDISNVNMKELAEEVFKDLKLSHPKRAIKFHIDPIYAVRGDLAMMRQVFVNLLSNAVKFTAGRKEAIIEIGSYVKEGDAVYYVKDNGVGFDMKYVGKLFGVFQRLHGLEEFEGTGVGLAIVQRIVHRHGGRVWAEGKVGQGATFYFSLPMMLEGV